MPSLKDYRNRIASVKSTRKITAAMKMVAASKLRRAQQTAEDGQPYSVRMQEMLEHLVAGLSPSESQPFLLAGTGNQKVHLLIIVTSDRGLCGGFNAQILRRARAHIRGLLDKGRTVRIICVGRKGRDVLKREFGAHILHTFEGMSKKNLSLSDAQGVADMVLHMASTREFDVCTMLYNEFVTVMNQEVTVRQLVPCMIQGTGQTSVAVQRALYEFEPSEEELLALLLPRNLTIQIFHALLDSSAGEQAARMTAMENSTKNAGEMIDKLTIKYNRARQAYITKELIEIISGAEAV